MFSARRTAKPFKLIYSSAAGGPGELAVGSRSMMQIMLAFSSYVDVPESDMKQGRAVPSLPSSDRDPVKIKRNKDKPTDAFAAVNYRDQWFWVDDRDWRSKRALSTIMFLFTIIKGTGDEQLPLVTIPAQ